MSSAICFNLDQSKILSSGNGLTLLQTSTYPEEYSLNNCGKKWRKLITSTCIFNFSNHFLNLHRKRNRIIPFPKQQLLDSSKLKEFADENSNFDENGKKFLTRVENTTGKGEIARYEQFLLFPQCFQRLVLQTCKNHSLANDYLSRI